MRCYLCRQEYGEPEDGDGVIEPEYGVCKHCVADAALGRAVSNFEEGMALFRQNPEWAFRRGYSGDIVRSDTPEDALRAAGLMEGAGE